MEARNDQQEGQVMFTFTIETITEKLAREYLATESVNRKPNQVTIRRYRNEINAGRWVLNGQAIMFDTEGHLFDGGHRLRARLGADLDFETLVIRGVDPAARWTTDMGRVRQVGQQLTMIGVRDGNNVGAGVRLYLTYATGILFRDTHVAQEVITSPLIEQWVRDNMGVVEELAGYQGRIKATDAPPSVAYAAAIIFRQISPATSKAFFSILATGAGGSEHPITVLDKRLQRHRREGINLSSRDALALYVQAWNAWIKSRTLSKFPRPRGGHWTALTFPKPVQIDTWDRPYDPRET